MIKLSALYERFFFTAAFIIGCFFVLSCENDTKVINDWTKNKVMTEEAKSVVGYLSQHGVMKAKLTAPLMLRVMADTLYTEFPKTLHVDFFNDSAKIESWLDSKYGKYFENLNKVYLRDSVVVINTKGDTLKCPDLWWDQNKKSFYTDKFTQYHTKSDQYYGRKGMEASQDLTSVKFFGGGGTVQVADSGLLKQ
ncbi:MAG: LPS export ABC transporter periplasmic protein LptC [Chitinophagales bacterium]